MKKVLNCCLAIILAMWIAAFPANAQSNCSPNNVFDSPVSCSQNSGFSQLIADASLARTPLIFDDNGSQDGMTALAYLLANPKFEIKAI